MPLLAPVRVLILTAPVGEGHVAAARALADDILERVPSADVELCDALTVFNRPLRWLLRDAYRWQLANAPWMFGAVFAGLRRSAVLRWLSRSLISFLGSRSVARVVRSHNPSVVVSTFPATSTILGCLRLRGQVRVPVCATITDFAGVEMWADRGVDLHLVMHESLVATVERVAGLASARVVSPLVSSRFLTLRNASDARRALGLPLVGRIVVVSGGGWGIGDLSGAVEAALELPNASIVCLAGRNPELRARLQLLYSGNSRVTMLGFTDQMSDLLAAADVIVHSSGGVTCLEALVRGCPVIAYGAPRGHAPRIAREMAALGLVEHARTRAELTSALSVHGSSHNAAHLCSVAAADLVLSARTRVVWRRRSRAARPLALAATVVALVVGLLASDLTYPLVAEALALPTTEAIRGSNGSISLVVVGDPGSLLAFAPLARAHHLRGSIAPTAPLTRQQVDALRGAGLDPIPAITAGGIQSALSNRNRLSAQIRAYGAGQHFYYLAPRDGFTIADYLLAHRLGGTPLQASADLANLRAPEVRSGQIVAAELRAGPGASQQLLGLWEHLATSVSSISPIPRVRHAET